MLKNYLKVSLRNLLKHKVFSIINISGLAIGMACSILIYLYVQHETSYDQFHEKKNRIFRLILEEKKGDELSQKLLFPAGMPQTLKEEYPEVEEGVEIFADDTYVVYNGNHLKAKYLKSYDGFFNIFTFPLLSGNPENVLSEPNNIVISESFAKRHFAGKNPLGLIIYSSETYSEPQPYLISGIMKDIPENSHLQADIIIANNRKTEFTNWQDSRTFSNHQYLLFSEQADVNAFEDKLSSFYTKYNFWDDSRLVLQPVTDIHLHSKFEWDMQPGGDIRYVYIFTAAALLILLIACINFVNLSTARYLNKAKEVGIRKTLGAFKGQLIRQFFTESLLYICLSFGSAILLLELMLPFFSQLYGKTLYSASLITFENALIFITALFMILIIAGAYPAFFLSSQKPVFILKKVLKSSVLDANLRKALVIFQFSISMVLIIATLVIYLQLNYISNKRLGVDQENLIVLPNKDLKNKWDVLKQELSKDMGVVNLSVSDLKANSYGNMALRAADPNDPENQIEINKTGVDADFLETLKAEMKLGRFFDPRFPADFQGLQHLSTMLSFSDSISELEKTRSIILNETAFKKFNLDESSIGNPINIEGINGIIIGVINDFHGKSLHQEIEPVILVADNNPNYGNVFIRISPVNINATLTNIEKTWKSLFPEQPFDFYFYEDSLQQLYISEKRMGKLFLVFAFLGILVACLGLLGLAVFSAEQRVKEIGIRKVLGASVKTIVALLTKDFLKLVILAVVIASPLGYYLLNIWLQGFAYKIDFEWWILICAGALAILIAFITISFQSVKAALTNPVDSLRSE